MGLILQFLLILAVVTPPQPVNRLPQEGVNLAGELADDESNAYNIATGGWTPDGRCWDHALGIAMGGRS